MYKDIGKDISKGSIEYTYLSIMSNKFNVGIIGGGKVGYIKSKNFLSKKCNVEVLSLNFVDDFEHIKNIKLIKKGYYKEFIKDKHLVIIATDNKDLNLKIKKDCEEDYKIYIFAEDYLNSMAIAPVQRNLNNISFAVNTNYGNPKGSLMVAEKIIETLKKYDEFIGYSSLIRKSAKNIEEHKKQIIDFVCSEDFKYMYEKKKDKIVIEMFFGEEVLNKIYKNL
ncbi:NAD(P)-dependent oxidoreductase [Clostridium nigeriense]|uniref:NAD(P)-dependent oxidoreductase n=1 Tax=Clostridium nigeriense TaxID=1805470 RepID=UPI003D342BC2